MTRNLDLTGPVELPANLQRARRFIALVALLSFPLPVAAQQVSEPAGGTSVRALLSRECASQQFDVETRDAQVVEAAEQGLSSGGYEGLRQHVGALEQVLSRAPRNFEAHESCKFQAKLIEGLTGAATVKPGDPNKPNIISIGLTRSPYPMASLLLGAEAIDSHQYDRASQILKKGLAMDPKDPDLASEAALALSRLGRNDEALNVLGRALKSKGDLSPVVRARLFRARGFALVETKRLGEAEKAYRQSLRFEPGHAGALRELTYIASLKAGGRPTEVKIMTAEDARKPAQE